jgi:ribose transport system substrate-binding protein
MNRCAVDLVQTKIKKEIAMRSWRKLKRSLLALAGSVGIAAAIALPAQAQAKIKIFLSLSYSGNAWQSEAANIVKALAATPPYDKLVDLREVISGTDVQAQISAYQSMIDAGAQGIISFPVSPTGLNRTIRRGCAKGVLFFMYDATVTEPCAYNISYITAGFGENTAQALVNALDGKGKIFLSRGVPGNSVDKRHTDGAMDIFNKYPGIKIIDVYYGMWSDETTQSETAKALAAHPDVDGIWAQAGEDGAIKALLATGRQKLIPVTGENSNGFRLALANPAYQARGLKGVSSGSPPATAGYAFKLMMEMLVKKRVLPSHNIQYPLPWVPAAGVTLCKGDTFANGCNTFPEGKVPDSFVTEVFEPTLLPELSLVTASEGKPTPGATIQPLPSDVVAAPDTPGINCSHCKPPAALYHLTKIEPTVQP